MSSNSFTDYSFCKYREMMQIIGANPTNVLNLGLSVITVKFFQLFCLGEIFHNNTLGGKCSRQQDRCGLRSIVCQLLVNYARPIHRCLVLTALWWALTTSRSKHFLLFFKVVSVIFIPLVLHARVRLWLPTSTYTTLYVYCGVSVRMYLRVPSKHGVFIL